MVQCLVIRKRVCFLLQILGEMVIGAFKHAGRRRMAFRVGTKMAKFHQSVREKRENREGGEGEDGEGWWLVSHSLPTLI